MPPNRSSFLAQLAEMWSRLQWPQRITIVSFGLLGLLLIGSVVFFMNRVEYEVLYSDLDIEDARAIKSMLEEQNRDYIVRGTSILVAAPKEEIDKLHLDIAGSGLGESGRAGWSLFDKNQFGLTDFTEQVNLQRALQDELSRTISRLSEISSARVHLVLPQESAFPGEEEDAKASVFVTLKKGSELSKTSVAGIKGVVAGAVRDLKRNNVTIVDDEGRPLSQSMESGDAARAEMESGIREQLESEMSSKVVSILEPLVGKGKVHANASIDLDFNTTEQTEETFDPNTPAILSQQKNEERSGGTSTAAGIPGTESNVGDAEPSTVSVPERIRQSEVTNYEVNRTVRHTIQPKGTIKRLSVAVILDHKTIYSKTEEGLVTSRTEPRSREDLNAFRELVLAAVGYNEARGDVVTIENVAFYSDARPEEPQPTLPWYYKWQSYLLPAMKYGAFLLLFLFVYLVLFRPIRKRVFQAMSFAGAGAGGAGGIQLPADSAAGAIAGTKAREELAASAGKNAAGLPAGESGSSDFAHALGPATDEEIERELLKEANAVGMDGRKFSAMKKKLVDKAKKDPEMVSQLIRSLIRERS